MKNDYFKYDTRKKDIKNEYLLIKIKKICIYSYVFMDFVYNICYNLLVIGGVLVG